MTHSLDAKAGLDWKSIDRATEDAEPRSVSVEDIAKIIDPHSFMDIPFTDDPSLLDMVEQSKQDAIRKAARILSALSALPSQEAEAVAVASEADYALRHHYDPIRVALEKQEEAAKAEGREDDALYWRHEARALDDARNAARSAPTIAPVAVSVKGLPLWQAGSWGDGSTPAGQANIFCEAYEVTIATGIDWVKADDIVTCHNEALSSIIPATKGGEDVVEALRNLLADCEEYSRINNLHGEDGSPATNHAMRRARAALDGLILAPEERRGNFIAVTTDEPQINNWHTAIYEDDYKGLLIAVCNQNGRYPWQVRAILAGLNAKNEALSALSAQDTDGVAK